MFVTGDDPVKTGLVASLNRPGGNLTGVTFFGGWQLGAKRLELLRDLISKAAVFAVLGDVNYPSSEGGLLTVEAAGRALGRQIVVVKVSSEREFEEAFTKIVQAGAGALLVSGGGGAELWQAPSDHGCAHLADQCRRRSVGLWRIAKDGI